MHLAHLINPSVWGKIIYNTISISRCIVIFVMVCLWIIFCAWPERLPKPKEESNINVSKTLTGQQTTWWVATAAITAFSAYSSGASQSCHLHSASVWLWWWSPMPVLGQSVPDVTTTLVWMSVRFFTRPGPNSGCHWQRIRLWFGAGPGSGRTGTIFVGLWLWTLSDTLTLILCVFLAPEILRGNAYGPEVDMWSVGVILYIL